MEKKPIPANLRGALILWDGDTPVQYNLEGIEMTVEKTLCSPGRVELSAQVAGEDFVDPAPRRDDIFPLLLELYAEQHRLGASDEALAATRHRIREHVKKETA